MPGDFISNLENFLLTRLYLVSSKCPDQQKERKYIGSTGENP